MSADTESNFHVRSFRRSDQAVCNTLYVDGLAGGKIAENDTGLDVDDIELAYMRSPGNHFWVAESDNGEVMGMVGVQKHDDGVGEIRRLRVRRDQLRRGIGSTLLETAIKFCRDQGCLKVALDTFVDRDPAIKLFSKFRFTHSRTKQFAGKELLYFYLDLYTSERPPSHS